MMVILTTSDVNASQKLPVFFLSSYGVQHWLEFFGWLSKKDGLPCSWSRHGRRSGNLGYRWMAFLRKIFGPSQEEIWGQVASQIGGRFAKGGFWHGAKVEAQVDEWLVTLDTYVVSTGKTHIPFTRLRAPYINADGFRFAIYRRSIFTGLGKFLGMQDVTVGYPEFDEAFVIKGTSEAKLRELFGNAKIRRLIQAQPGIHFQVRKTRRTRGYPPGADELSFHVPGVLKDLERLKSLYKLFGETLNQLCHMGSAYENDPTLHRGVPGEARR